MEYLIIALSSYLLGSIPFGFILTKIFLNKDIRDIGSGNIGATNALRTGNKTLGYTTLLLDITKAVLPVLRALAAPMFPEPISLISFFKKIFVSMKPNGIDPNKYELKATIKYSIIIT